MQDLSATQKTNTLIIGGIGRALLNRFILVHSLQTERNSTKTRYLTLEQSNAAQPDEFNFLCQFLNSISCTSSINEKKELQYTTSQ